MLAIGIYNLGQLKRRHLESSGGKTKGIALDLYSKLSEASPEDRDYFQEHILRRAFTSNETFKFTYSDRFGSFDETCIDFIKKNFPVLGKEMKIHDIGASDGRTSMNFYRNLERIYEGTLDFLASDFSTYYTILRYRNGKARIIVDEYQNIIQVVVPPFVFSPGNPPGRFPLTWVLRWFLERFYAEPLFKSYVKGDTSIEAEKLNLICEDFRQNVGKSGNTSFEQYDILSGPRPGFHVIRVMNLLNVSYFSTADLQRAVENVFCSLEDGGLFITGSNMEKGSVLNASIYKKEGESLKCLFQSGEGAIVNSIITEKFG